VLFASVLFTFVTVGPMHRSWGKRATGVATAIAGMVFWVIPFLLRDAGWWWTDGSTIGTGALFVFFFFANWVSVAAMVSISSMIADVVEASEAETGRRSEATFFAGHFFMQKCATGLGIFISGLLIDLSGVPEKAQPGEVAQSAIDTLALSYALIVAIFAVLIALVLRRFPITRAEHEARVAALAGAARVDVDAAGAHP
jgi:GPH family glycoside/pentoside/hexuronide:cation symporter